MSVLNNRLTWLLVIVVSMLAFIFYKSVHSVVPSGYAPAAAANLSDSAKKVRPISASATSVSTPVNEKINTNPTKESYMVLTPAETGELKSWVAARGYFSKDDEEIYKSYSDNVLDDLGKRGDIKALTVLASRMVQSGNIEAAIRYANMNVVLGSTTALDTLTLFDTVPSIYEENEVKIRSATLETLAVAQVMNLRGDRTLASVSMNDTANSYKRTYKTDLKLTDVEQQFVEKRGQELYDAYQAIRREKGLGDFDNEDPSPIKKFFGLE